MRLINTHTLELKQFFSGIPEYAILSHRWSQRPEPDDEATLRQFQEFQKARSIYDDSTICVPAGIQKVLDFCRIAMNHDLEWAWLDTVCIDKTNNTELSEAINSMFRWYQESALCFVYLQDVDGRWNFSRSDWFKRGWTLQELIAPKTIIFCGCDWTSFGTKETLSHKLSGITGIPTQLLYDPGLLSKFSAAQRISWASSRETTRPEDIAYCMLGLFGIYMSLFYGEGAEEAFLRLQKAILERFEDETLFVWKMEDQEFSPYPSSSRHGISFGRHPKRTLWQKLTASLPASQGFIMAWKLNYRVNTGIFARSPQQFSRSGHVEVSRNYRPRMPLSITNRGVQMTRHVYKLNEIFVLGENDLKMGSSTALILPLACSIAGSDSPCYIVTIQDSDQKERFCRLMFRKDDLEALEMVLQNGGCHSSEQHFFVRINWPAKAPRVVQHVSNFIVAVGHNRVDSRGGGRKGFGVSGGGWRTADRLWPSTTDGL